jgi:hypothetical protein
MELWDAEPDLGKLGELVRQSRLDMEKEVPVRGWIFHSGP